MLGVTTHSGLARAGVSRLLPLLLSPGLELAAPDAVTRPPLLCAWPGPVPPVAWPGTVLLVVWTGNVLPCTWIRSVPWTGTLLVVTRRLVVCTLEQLIPVWYTHQQVNQCCALTQLSDTSSVSNTQTSDTSVVSDDHSVINTLDWQRLTRRSVRYCQKICRAGAIRVMSGVGES